jgi:hypothetical protein
MGPPGAEPAADAEAMERLAEGLSQEFVEHKLGSRRVARWLRTGGRCLLEVSHEDRLRALQRFEGGGLAARWWRPVLHAAGSYHVSLGRLKLKTPRNRVDLLPAYVRHIGEVLFGEPDRFSKLSMRLDLDVLLRRRKLRLDPEHGGGEANVMQVSLSPPGGGHELITLKIGAADDMAAMLERYGLDLLDAGDLPDELLHGPGDAVLDLGGAGAGHLHHDVDHRDDDLRLLLAGKQERRKGAEGQGPDDEEWRQL